MKLLQHPRLSRRTEAIQPFYVMELLARARQLEAAGRDIVHMEIGEPDFPTAAPIVEAGRRALAAGETRYTPALGLPQLRSAIASHYATRYGVEISAERVVITPGASAALHLVLAALVNPGDEVVMADPGYPCNRHFVRLVEGQSVAVPVDARSAYQLSAPTVSERLTPRSAVILAASPSNPTGTVIPGDELMALTALAAERNIALVVDEIYHGLSYDKAEQSVLSFTDQAFVVNSFSKYFGMTGWRLGWCVVPKWAVRALDKLAQNIYIAASTPAQHAALAAFEPETLTILEQRRRAFQDRRDFLLPALRELGFHIPIAPQGAFYLYADSSRFGDSGELATRWLEEFGIAVTPGLDFGDNEPERYLRFAYTVELERLREGVERLRRALESERSR